MLVIVLLTVVVILITYIYLRWIQLKQYWAKRNVPHAPPHPVFGSLTFLQRENPAVWFRSTHDNYKEPYIGIWIFWRPGLLVNSPGIAKNILIKDQANFRNRLTTSGSTDPFGKLNLFSLDDPLWTVIRKRLSPLFTNAKLRSIQILLIEKSKELVERIDKERQKAEPIDIRNMMTDFSTDIIGTSSFGVVSDATLTGNSALRSITKEFMKFGLFRSLSWCCAFFIPELVDFFRFKIFPVESTDYMRKIIREVIAQRGLANKVTEPRDLLDILIKMKQESDKELDVTENMMIAQAAVFLQAGFETTALTLTFSVYELAFCTEAQEKLYEELKQANNKYGENLLEATVLSQLTYLNCVINAGKRVDGPLDDKWSTPPMDIHNNKDVTAALPAKIKTLRKYPGLPWLDRIALEDYKVDDQLTIKAGTPVYVNVVGLHYDPEYYPEPDRFNPDRFLPENEVNNQPYTYLPFGEGPRICIGQRLGLSSVRHALAAVMLHYEVRKLADAPKPSEIKMDKRALNFAPVNILPVEFVPRKEI